MTQSAVDLSLFQNRFSQFMSAMVDLAKGYHLENQKFRENFKFSCYEELLQIHGKLYDVMSDEEYPFNRKHSDPEASWRTALQYTHSYPNLIYTEGLAIIEGKNEPIDHAWLIDTKTERVFDPTFRREGLSYFGIPFNTDFVEKRATETGLAGIFPFDLESESPILMNGLPEGCIWTPTKK
jgi:hypothetical protein